MAQVYTPFRVRPAAAEAPEAPRFRFFDFTVPSGDARTEILAGLRAPIARIAPKFFYDDLGARLFEAICELPEYSLTRDERSILDRAGPEIAREIGPIDALIDLGAGNSEKAERLLPVLKPLQYVGVDIARDFLAANLESLAQRHPRLEVIGIAQDFTDTLRLPPAVRTDRRVFFYPGSSLGNFSPDQAAALLERVCAQTAGGHLLLGADLVKDKAELVAAYDDALGVTAAFNLNVLNRANELAGTNFDLDDWQHVALFNPRAVRIEMHLQARKDVVVRWSDGQRAFASGERIHTENSHKYTLPGLRALLEATGFVDVRFFTDDEQRFAIALASA